MRNRAKCKLCADILESFHEHDWVTCKCGEISIDGGNHRMDCSAKNWENFLRVDDNGNTIVPKVVQKDGLKPDQNDSGMETDQEQSSAMTPKEKIDMLQEMIKNLENLPQNVMSQPINHYDFYTYLLLVSAILSDLDKK